MHAGNRETDPDRWESATRDCTVYREPDRKSECVADLAIGDPCRFGAWTDRNGSMWREVNLPDGRHGFVWIARLPRPISRWIPAGLLVGLLATGVIVYSFAFHKEPETEWKPPADIVIRNGESHRFGRKLSFTLWENAAPSDVYPERNPKSAILYAQGEKRLLDSAVIEAPQGLEVIALKTELNHVPTEVEYGNGQSGVHRRTFRAPANEYALEGLWQVSVPADFPEGSYSLKIDYPAIATLKEELRVRQPAHGVMFSFPFRTVKSQ